MTNFGDILQNWETQKKSEKKVSSLPQDGQAWRNKKTGPDKKIGDNGTLSSSSQRNPMSERSEDDSPSQRNPMSERSEDDSPLKRNPMSVWLQRYGVIDKDSALEQEKEQEQQSNRDAVKQMPCDASIDLHGLTRDESLVRLQSFITECCRRGLRKVLIIHGKGNHSDQGPILSHAVRSYIESDKRLGQFGFADKNLGGKGATWVLIREKTDI